MRGTGRGLASMVGRESVAWAELLSALVTPDGREKYLLAVVPCANRGLLGLNPSGDYAALIIQVLVHSNVGILSRLHANRGIA